MQPKYWLENLKGRDHSEVQGIDGRTILKIKVDLGEVGWEEADWAHLVQDRNRQWTLVNTIILASCCENQKTYISTVPQDHFYNNLTIGSILLHIKQHVLAT
jgi:hypothetical protein